MNNITINITELERIMREWGAIPGDWRHFFSDLKKANIKSTPDWSTAPDWANWRAMDADGRWYLFENKPRKSGTCWLKTTGQWALDYYEDRTWESSLQQRLNRGYWEGLGPDHDEPDPWADCPDYQEDPIPAIKAALEQSSSLLDYATNKMKLTLENTERGIEIHRDGDFVAEVAREDEGVDIVRTYNRVKSLGLIEVQGVEKTVWGLATNSNPDDIEFFEMPKQTAVDLLNHLNSNQ